MGGAENNMRKSLLKLEKVNERLYREIEKGEGRPLNWSQCLENLFIKLYDVEPICNFSFENNEEDKIQSAEEEDALKKLNEYIIRQVSTERKLKKLKRRIEAKVVLENRSINLIEDDGTISFSDGFRVADFTCHEGDGVGSLIHMDESMLEYCKEHSKPFICIETYLPNELFEKLWSEIAEQNFSGLSALVKVDVYQSEMERSLAEPWMHQEYTIEKGSYKNFCGLESISVNGKKILPQPKDEDWFENEDMGDIQNFSQDNDNKNILSQKDFLLEIRKTNKLIKWLIFSIFLFGFFVLISNS